MSAAKLLSLSPVVVLLGLLAGCAATPMQNDQMTADYRKTMMTVPEVENAKLSGNIGLVHPSFNIFPWLQFDPADPRPQGFAVQSLYLIDNKTERGVFADGTIVVRMYRVDREPDGRETRPLVHTWRLNPAQAMPFRSHRRTVFGVGYMLLLQWPKNLDVLNREIMVIVEFERPDGKVISSHPKFLKVPTKMNG